MADAFKSVEILRPGGVLILDDHFRKHDPRAVDNPAGAINALLQLEKGSCRVLRVSYPLIIQRLAEETEAHRGAAA